MVKKENEFDYKEANVETLTQKLNETGESLFKLRFRAASAPLKNTMAIRHLRREKARLQTFITQRAKTESGSKNANPRNGRKDK